MYKSVRVAFGNMSINMISSSFLYDVTVDGTLQLSRDIYELKEGQPRVVNRRTMNLRFIPALPRSSGLNGGFENVRIKP